MTGAIEIRENPYGNDAHHVFHCPTAAVEHILANPSYEIVPDGEVRPYGDIDHYVSADMSERHFNNLDNAVYLALVDWGTYIDRTLAIECASSYEKRKISYHWVLPQFKLASRKHAKLFAEKIYNNNLALALPEGVKGDLSVYSSRRKMRCLGTSKPGENRPLVDVSYVPTDLTDHLIGYTSPNAELIDIELPKEKARNMVEAANPDDLLRVLNEIDVKYWTDYASCLRLIFAMKSSGASDDLIHEYCKKAKNYGEKWVDNTIRGWDEARAPTFGTLVWFATQSNPSFRLRPCSRFEELTQLTTDETTLFDWNTHDGYLRELPEHNTLAVKAMMGTGKSTEMIRLCREAIGKNQRVAIVSVRKTWAAAFHAELPMFTHYLDSKESAIPENVPVIIQIQSLHRLEGNTYDLFIADECESVLATLKPNKTHKKFEKTMRVFESIVANTTKVMFMDAFLTDRTTTLLNTLRGCPQIVVNPCVPFNRTATITRSEMEYKRMLAETVGRKRVMSFWATNNAATSWANTHKADGTILYQGDKGDTKLKEKHLADVDKYWSQYRHVSYTPTITVGINYNGTPFDQQSFYASPFSCVPRDQIQALHRARKLGDDHMFGYVESKPAPTDFGVEAGLEFARDVFKKKADRKRLFVSMYGDSSDMYTIPRWLEDVMIWNANEIITGKKHFEEVFVGYLKLCGVNPTVNGIADQRTKKCSDTDGSNGVPKLADIRTLLDEEAILYQKNRRGLTQEQNFELEKWFCSRRCKNGIATDRIWDMWNINNRWVERTHAQLNSSAQAEMGKQQGRIVELLPTDIEKHHAIRELGFDFSRSFSIPVEEIKRVNLDAFHLRVRTDKDTPEQYARDIKKVMKDWNTTQLEVNSKRVRKGDELGYTYSLTYDTDKNPFYADIAKVGDVFAVEDPI